MLKKVQISLQSIQYDPPEKIGDNEKTPEPISITQNLPARWRETEDEISLSYTEPDPDTKDGAQVQLYFLKKDPTTLTLTRNGAQNYVLVFNEQQRCSSEYQLGNMSLELAIATRRLTNTLHKDGKLHLEYVVELQGCSNGLRIIDIRLDDPLSGIVREYR